jgi:gamma-glutamyltranspeptidase / glutathione hydrolase
MRDSELRTDRARPRRTAKSAVRTVPIALLLFLAACRQGEPRDSPATVAPAPPAGVAAANPMAVDAGLEVLGMGGSAVDAAVAVQAMLGLVEPQSSGLGGGAFMMYYEASSGKVIAFNGRETAPAAAEPNMFIGEDGQPLSFSDAVLSGRSTGVPGALPMLGAAHARFGRLPWRKLFEPAIRMAEHGFTVPQRLAFFANSSFPQAQLPDPRTMFARPDGTPVQAGDTLRNSAYAETLRRVADGGPRTLHRPPISDAIIARTGEPPRPGRLVQADFDAYQPVSSEPVCGPYRVYVVCVPPPPSSGVSLLQLLAILDRTDIAERGPDDPQAWFLFAEAMRLIYADRDEYIADPEFVSVPVDGLLEPKYVEERARLIGTVAGPAPSAGRPHGVERGRDATVEPSGTSHFVIIDAEGNVVSMTTSVESLFGSGRAVNGFMLNNQLTDFSAIAVVDGRPVANAVAGGKRPRSSMSPVIVLDAAGHLLAALGSPGGSAILAYNAKTLIGLLAWDLSMQQAIDLPNLYARGVRFSGEEAKFAPAVLAGLAARGIAVQSGQGENSGLHGIIYRGPGQLEGAADPRREGVWRTTAGLSQSQ